MLSFGSAAFTIDKQVVGSFSANLDLLEDAMPDPETMAWWGKNQRAFEATREDTRAPAAAMEAFEAHIAGLAKEHGRPVFMGYPGTYDFGWINWYFHRFLGRNPFGISALCLKSYGMAMQAGDFRRAIKRRFPQRWFDRLPHTHVALDDAIEQGAMGINMLRESRGLEQVTGIPDGNWRSSK